MMAGRLPCNVRKSSFIRALQYYYIMDLYGNAAFTEEVSSEFGRTLYTYPVFQLYYEELKECEADMAEPGQNTYGRVDKVTLHGICWPVST
ncbi:hypothetical protein [Bacteroides uniformis]|uniref:hypothetical protein n=1 Tax=Bacteroides uniformis TaxID=820 RepID=UPI0021660BFA|nr:hypothetical protein [Bacteroides uniformis]MCS2415975.1 hypothetical protein [Bacteroides uniformis]